MQDETPGSRVRVDGHRLDVMLRRKQLTLTTLAEKMGMHYNSLLHIKRFGGTNLGTLARMCEVLECHPFDLLVAEGYPQPFYPAPVNA